MVHKVILWMSNIAAIILLAFFPGATQFIAERPYMVAPVFVGAWAAWYLALLILFWLFMVVISLTINKNKQYEKQSRFHGVLFAWLLENAVWWCGGRAIVTGMEKLPKPSEGRFLFVSNHRSIFDTFIQVTALWRYPMAFISKPENFNILVGNQFMRRCKYMAINRADVRDGARITSNAANMMKTGDSCIGVYPEGTRNRTEDILLPFKDGCFKSALWAKVPIVIGVIHNSAKIHPNFPKPTKVHFEIVDVLPYEEIKGLKTPEIAEIVRAKMLAALEADYRKPAIKEEKQD